jgi:hypothetical protein
MTVRRLPPRAALAAALLVVLGLVAVLAGDADAAAPASAATPWVGAYALALKGSQGDNWTLHHEPTGPCDAKTDGTGSESDDITAVGAVPIIATGIGNTVLTLAGGGFQKVALNLSRSGSITQVDPTPTEADGCPAAGGSGGGETANPNAGPGCGSRSGTMNLLITGLGVGLHVQGDDTSFTTAALAGEEPGTPFVGCPNLGITLPALLPVDLLAIAAGGALPGYGPAAIVLSGTATAPATAADVYGVTATRLDATLTGSALATNVTASAKDIQISSAGVANVTLSCPRKARASRCTGTLAEVLTPASADDDDTSAPATLPAPVPTGAHRIGTATAFRIVAGHRKKVRMALPRGTQVAALSGLTLPIVLTQTGRKGRKLSYVVARAHPRG